MRCSFGQEQNPIGAITDVQGGEPGAAATIGGAAISDLLGGANPCDKLTRADQILAELGNGQDAIDAAIGLVAAEKNTNPFVNGNVPTVCGDPTLPQNAILRGITPLIDPDATNAAVANALSAQTLGSPLNADGLSVADLLVQNGFTELTAVDAAGNQVDVGAGGAAAADGADDPAGNAADNAGDAAAVDDAAAMGNDAAAANNAASDAQLGNACAALAADGAANNGQMQQHDQNANQNNNQNDNQNDNQNANQAATGGADFGQCDPSIKFEGGVNGRPADEFTFLPIDSLVAEGQQEALNPNIITNRVCDQLINVCEANDAAVTLCESAKAEIEALGTRDQTTADTFNSLLGFGGAAKVKARSMRRGRRAF
ncbi:hypothetical protein AJ80_03836 [Polytolypa hystricis UAMH7299]|uniref:Circumsporozoite protein n=1 Tax=Polytolypa hystricis (strain UAMH7299) TaxID=1447883 RepID=A0A2B7YF52_POLH7|nr:hypothetical protein AJ80_03836 [Polytolypa hystricis UAMH7299]